MRTIAGIDTFRADDGEELLRRGFVEWLSKGCGVLRFVGGLFQLSLHGSSSRYGEYLANAIRQGERWALIVRDEMWR